MVALARTRDAIEDATENAIEDAIENERAEPIGGLDPRAATKILSRAVRASVLRYGEALALPASALAGLPLAPSLVLRAAGLPGHVRVELAADRAEAARADGEVVLDAGEWEAIRLGAEADRLWPADFAALCARKRSDPSFRIDAETALAGAQADPAEAWAAARVLERVGADVVSIELE